jgi:hypothetical protein
MIARTTMASAARRLPGALVRAGDSFKRKHTKSRADCAIRDQAERQEQGMSECAIAATRDCEMLYIIGRVPACSTIPVASSNTLDSAPQATVMVVRFEASPTGS